MLRERNGFFESLCNEMKDVTVLTKKEVSILIKNFHAGDKNAAEKIALHNIRLVISLATHFVKKYNIDYDDIIGYGVIGLYKAINKFDPDLNYTFSTYARGWIMQAIGRNYIAKRDVVNSSQRRQEFSFESFDDPVYWKSQDTCTAIEYEQKEIFAKNIIEKYLDKLPNQKQLILRSKFGFNSDKKTMTLRDIGKIIGLSRETVRQILNQLIREMKYDKKLRELVGK